MSTLEKMKILTDSAQYDLCDYVSHNKSSQVNLPGIYEAIGHNGCKIPLFKTLLTNKCKNDCKYCINQSKRNFTIFTSVLLLVYYLGILLYNYALMLHPIQMYFSY